MEIIPAIIPKDDEDLKEKLETVKELAETVHIDFINPPIAPSFIKEGVKGVDFLEAHLMLPRPQEYIADVVRAGFSRVLVHVVWEQHRVFEAHQHSVLPEMFAELIHEWKGSVEIGAVLEIETPLDAIDSFAHELETVQLMGIAEIGAQGRPFDTRVIGRVRSLHTKYPHLTISVDGGVNKKNAERLAAVGAERLVVGSHLADFYNKDTPPFLSP